MWGATDLFGKAIAPHLSFNSRTPCGVRPADCITAPPLAYSFNSRTPCGVRLSCFLSIGPGRDVSIHAPRVGCDRLVQKQASINLSFNSRTPCGVRQSLHLSNIFLSLFQFTHPVWGATYSPDLNWGASTLFQFTHPVWGATGRMATQGDTAQVSIHAPRVGCDLSAEIGRSIYVRFNSRTPCGVRLEYGY